MKKLKKLKKLELNTDSAYSLVKGILVVTYYEYTSALRFYRDNIDKYKLVESKVIDYQKYCDLKKQYAISKNKINHRTLEDRQVINTFESTKAPTKPSKEQIELFKQFNNNNRTIEGCESFYKSDLFRVYTLCLAPTPENIIKRIRKSVFKERMCNLC